MVEDDDQIVPKWLTMDYLEPILQKYKKDTSLQIKSLKVEPASSKGQNYLGIMLRVKAEFVLSTCKRLQQESFVIKASCEDDPSISDYMKGYDCCNTEMQMYEKVVPELSKLLRDIGDDDKLFAETIHVDYDHSAIIFEDLAVSNFVCGDRLGGMDLDEARLALKKLAKMHATAAVFNERQPNVLQRFDRGIFNRYTKGFTVCFEYFIEICAKFAGNTTELGDYYKEKLLRLKPNMIENIRRVFDLEEGHFHTLNHGDFWINNVMFKYCNGTQTRGKIIQDMILLDFQFPVWTSPAVDLHYFFNTSLESKLRLYHQDELIQYYHEVLIQTLRKFQFSGYVPSLHELFVQLQSKGFYAVSSSLVVQPIMINDKTEDASMQSIILDDERGRNFRNVVYANKIVQENVKVLLPYFDRKGLLDIPN